MEPEDRFERFLRALQAVGYRIEGVAGRQPWTVEVEDPSLERDLELLVYLWGLRSDPERPALRIRIDRPDAGPLPLTSRGPTLLLGYGAGQDVYAAWQVEARPAPAQGSSARVHLDLIEHAGETGIAGEISHPQIWTSSPVEIVTAFRPEQMRTYLEALPSLRTMRGRMELEGVGPAIEAMDAPGIDLLVPDRGGRPRRLVPTASADPRPPRTVSTGFADAASGETYDRETPLRPGSNVDFLFEVGAPADYSIERTPTELPIDLVPDETELAVVVYAQPDGFELEAGNDVGFLSVDKRGQVSVSVAVGGLAQSENDVAQLRFPMRVPAQPGRADLRCNVYCLGALVQSRRISAWVGAPPETGLALDSRLEYSLSRSLHPRQLATHQPTTFSLMLNGDGGTHEFRFFAANGDPKEPSIASASFDKDELRQLIAYCRGALRLAAWGTQNEWCDKKDEPRYDSAVPTGDLLGDLVEMAKRGRQTYEEIKERLKWTKNPRELADVTGASATVQIAAVASLFVPAALFYDPPGFDTGLAAKDYQLCEDFVRAKESNDPLERCKCFAECCSNRQATEIVCPSGFWGYRHAIGWPLSDPDVDAVGVLAYDGQPAIGVAVATDLELLAKHEHDLKEVLGNIMPETSREGLFEMIRRRDHLVYVYCHGGETEGGAVYLRVGDVGAPWILADQLGRLRPEGDSPPPGRPLVFLNGCRTTAAGPDARFGFIQPFVDRVKALGVIGTETTVFEETASRFATAFFRSFVTDRQSVGEAVRRARLAVLKQGNPLALAYVPFVMPGVKLQAAGPLVGRARQG